jgi:inner membrane transporter RhtA
VYFLVSAVFHYLGPSFAVLLFARVPVLGVAWMRIAVAAIVFGIWRRPWRAVPRSALKLVCAWGTVLALMNCCFYEAIHRLPLGTVATIEFLPVIALAAVGTRTARNAFALALAVAGVALISDVQLPGQPLGIAFALANASLFALYIVLAHRASRHSEMSGIDGLGAAMLIAAVVVTPIGGWQVLGSLHDPIALLAGAGVGISSSVIPYVTDQLAMARLSRATYSLMVALLPATAVVVGVIVLAQLPTATELLAVALVIAGVAVHREQDEPATPRSRPGGLALPNPPLDTTQSNPLALPNPPKRFSLLNPLIPVRAPGRWRRTRLRVRRPLRSRP